jgi:hypothetical protein
VVATPSAPVRCVGIWCEDHAVAIKIPGEQPNQRFMRYVRAPIGSQSKLQPLFPLRPGTRPLRLGIDVTTLPTPPAGLLTKFFQRDEIDVQLLVPEGEQVPPAWLAVLGEPLVRQIGFASVASAGRLLDSVQFTVVPLPQLPRRRGAEARPAAG